MKSSNDNLLSLIGRLEQISYAVPHAKFFLNRLRHLQLRTVKQESVTITKSVLQDLLLCIDFTRQAAMGTSINNLVYRRPSHFFWSDSCPFGLGGYSARGRAVALLYPPVTQIRTHKQCVRIHGGYRHNLDRCSGRVHSKTGMPTRLHR